MKRLLCVLLLVAACGDASVMEAERPDFARDAVELRVLGPGRELRLSVLADVADTAAERAGGLSDRASLEPTRGLLLVFPAETNACITNRPVVFDIDVVFAAQDGRIVAVEREWPAGSTEVRCHDSTAFVLEVATAVASAVEIGDILLGQAETR